MQFHLRFTRKAFSAHYWFTSFFCIQVKLTAIIKVFFAQEAKRRVEGLTEGVRANKTLYSQTMRSLETISNRIHESRRQGEWLRSPRLQPRFSGVGLEDDKHVVETTRSRDSTSSLCSLPSSPRRTPPGQADTDTEAESEIQHRDYQRKSADLTTSHLKSLIEVSFYSYPVNGFLLDNNIEFRNLIFKLGTRILFNNRSQCPTVFHPGEYFLFKSPTNRFTGSSAKSSAYPKS